ncbi:MAG: DUF1674 domain-containing protein [Alphaproteobacteria bacterium]|nr:DUF1674 domain-containing protein [Alphaproteobacteria bacterium]
MNDEKQNDKNTGSIKKLQKPKDKQLDKEIGGYEDQNLLEPTRYGDWDVKGRCSDF